MAVAAWLVVTLIVTTRTSEENQMLQFIKSETVENKRFILWSHGNYSYEVEIFSYGPSDQSIIRFEAEYNDALIKFQRLIESGGR